MDCTIKTTPYGIALFGEVPVELFTNMCKLYKHGVIDTEVAGKLGAIAAICKDEKASLAWRDSLGIGPNASDWLDSGDTGLSSKTIYAILAKCPNAMSKTYGPATPSDPDDFGRCYRLCQRFGWHDRIKEVAASYPMWKPLSDQWHELVRCFEEEGKLDERGFATVEAMPKTYALMQLIEASTKEVSA